MRRIVSIFAAAAVCAVSIGQALAREGSIATLVAAERKFAAESVATSTQHAFLANLGDDSVLFQPYPVPGRAWTESHPGGSGLLTWEPTFASISGSGDMGFTSGPWEYRKGRSLDESPIAYGHFSTVWRLNDDGVWRVAIDCGVSHSKPDVTDTLVLDTSTTRHKGAGTPSTATAGARESILKAEVAFSRTLAASGPVSAYAESLADGARIFRDDTMPAVGRRNALELVKADGSAVTWSTDGGATSKLGDLGYTYGRGERPGAKQGASEHFTFMRIWQRTGSGEWKIALDVLNGVPEASGTN